MPFKNELHTTVLVIKDIETTLTKSLCATGPRHSIR